MEDFLELIKRKKKEEEARRLKEGLPKLDKNQYLKEMQQGVKQEKPFPKLRKVFSK